jgi:hypothetical protein
VIDLPSRLSENSNRKLGPCNGYEVLRAVIMKNNVY